MRRIVFTALLCCAVPVSCGMAGTTPDKGREDAAMDVCLHLSGSKSGYDNAGSISNIYVAVFDGDDNLEKFCRMDVAGLGGDSSDVRIQVTQGRKTVHAVANVTDALAEELGRSLKKKDFLSSVTVLDRDNVVNDTGEHLLMHGSIDGKDSVIEVGAAGIEGTDSCTIVLERLVSKICLHGICNMISEPPIWKDCEMEITGIFLFDAIMEDCIGESSGREPSYGGRPDSPLLFDRMENCRLRYGESYEKSPFEFYTYSGSGDRTTSLCLEAVLMKGDASRKCYYNIPVIGMERNKLYKITNITIKSEGTDNPGDDHTYEYVSVDLDDGNWDAGEDTFLEY